MSHHTHLGKRWCPEVTRRRVEIPPVFLLGYQRMGDRTYAQLQLARHFSAITFTWRPRQTRMMISCDGRGSSSLLAVAVAAAANVLLEDNYLPI